MPDLNDGEHVEIQGSGAKPYIIKNVAGVYSCSCPAWRNQSLPIERRTCKHIRKFRGDAAEEARLGDALAAPRRPAETGETKEGPPVLLAETWDATTSLVGWWMSEKLDGVRAYWDGKQFLSRLGNVYLAPDWFIAGLPDVPLDGELWLGRKAFQRTVSIARRQDRSEHWRELRFVIFDAPATGGPFEDRMGALETLLGRRGLEFVELVAHQQCRSMDHLHSEMDRIESLGGEGLMLRQPGSHYIAGRSSTLLKVKRFHDAEARVIAHEPGEGRHKGRLGALLVELPHGTRFSIGTGLSDAERNNPPPIGSIVSFRFQELSDRGVPRFPSYLGIREDGLITPMPTTPAPVRVPAPAAPSERTHRLTYHSGDTVRVWEAKLSGSRITLTFGTEGGKMQTRTLDHASAKEASAALDTLIADKIDDGFTEGAATPIVAPRAESSAPVSLLPGEENRRHFEFVAGTSSKFWEVWVEGVRVTTRYGRIGTSGTMTIKDHPDEAAAVRAGEKLIVEKTSKGYVER